MQWESLGNGWRNNWRDFRVPGGNWTSAMPVQNFAQAIELEQPLVSWVSWLGSSRQSVSQVLQIS